MTSGEPPTNDVACEIGYHFIDLCHILHLHSCEKKHNRNEYINESSVSVSLFK